MNDLFAAQLQQHLVCSVVAVFGSALAKAPNPIGVDRQRVFARSFNQQAAAGCGLYFVVGILLGDFEAEELLPGGCLSAGCHERKRGYNQQAGTKRCGCHVGVRAVRGFSSFGIKACQSNQPPSVALVAMTSGSVTVNFLTHTGTTP